MRQPIFAPAPVQPMNCIPKFHRLVLSLATCLTALAMSAAEPWVLWPNGAPGEKGGLAAEHDTSQPGDGLVDGKTVVRLGNVSVPTITLYRPDPAVDTGAAVIVCPGGGYHILAMDLEGTEVCQWLNSIGVNAVLLKYRVPARAGAERYLAPLQDAQRALGLVRSRAAGWKLDPHRIGIMGFSAGGHLSAAASTRFAQRAFEPVDAADQESCRPDFALLIYPAYLVPHAGPALAPELTVTSNTPPTFLFQAEDDGVHVECSLYYYLALKQAQVPAELHILPSGGHGYGLRGAAAAPASWPKMAEAWLRRAGVLAGHQH